MKLSNIFNNKPDNKLKNKIKDIRCKSGVEVDHNAVEDFHRLPASRHI